MFFAIKMAEDKIKKEGRDVSNFKWHAGVLFSNKIQYSASIEEFELTED